MRVIGKTIQQRKARLNCESLLSFDGVDQYADAGVNENVIQAVNFDRDFAVSLFFISRDFSELRHLIGLKSGNQNGFNLFTNPGGTLNVWFGSKVGNRVSQAISLNLQLILRHVVINYSAATTDFSFWVNTVNQPFTTNDKNGLENIHTGSSELKIARRDNFYSTTSHTPCDLNHLTFFNRTLTQLEIQSIHYYGGWLSSDELRLACVVHYVADRQGFRLWDVVEQYNDAKVAAGLPTLSAYHANLINFTPQQVEGSGQEAYRDFYIKESIQPYFYRAKNALYSQLNGVFPYQVDYSQFQLTFRARIRQTLDHGSGYTSILKVGYARFSFSANGLRIHTKEDTNTRRSDLLANNLTGQLLNQWAIVEATIDSYDVNEWTISVNGVVQASSIEFNELLIADTISGYSQNVQILGGAGDTFDLDWCEVYTGIGENKTLIERFTASGYDNTITPAAMTGKNGTVLTHNRADYKIHSPYLFEKSSLLPPLRNALRFDAASNQYASVANFNPSKEKGYTVLTAFALESDRDFTSNDIDNFLTMRGNGYFLFHPELEGGDNHIKIRFNSIGLAANVNKYKPFNRIHLAVATVKEGSNGNQLLQIYFDGQLLAEQNNSSNLNTSFMGFDQIEGPLSIGADLSDSSRKFSGLLLQTGIAKGIITPGQVIELWKNSLLANPKASWTNLEWQLLPNFNAIQDDGAGNYTLTDNSPQNHAINLQGFSTANLDAADPAYSLRSINSLRTGDVELLPGPYEPSELTTAYAYADNQITLNWQNNEELPAPINVTTVLTENTITINWTNQWQ